jgi:hypothetical protein
MLSLEDIESCTTKPFSAARWLQPLPAVKPAESISQAEIAACREKRYLLHTRHTTDYFAGHSHKT